jgi:hypothetical protein
MSTTITITEQTAIQNQAMQVVQLAGNIHGFATTPTTPATPAMPQEGGQVLGSGPSPGGNQLLQDLHRARMLRQGQGQAQAQTQTSTAPSQPEAPPSTQQPNTAAEGVGSLPRFRTRAGSPDPDPPGGGSSTVLGTIDRSAIDRLLRELAEERSRFLLSLWKLVEAWQLTPLIYLDILFEQVTAIQRQMQALEFRIARRIAGSGPPGDPGGGGSHTVSERHKPIRLRLRPDPARIRFQHALAQMQALQGQLLAGQQERAQQSQNFAATAQALSAQLQPAPSQAWHNMVQQHQNFQNAQAALQHNPPPPAPNGNWQQMIQQHHNFLNAVAALTNNPPPVQPTANWHQVMQQHANFGNALQALMLHPPPVQPMQAWHNMVQQVNNFQHAVNALLHHPPQPLLQPPPVNNANHAPMPYAVPHNNAQHILHGNHGGGQHMGMYNPAPHGAHPNVITHFHFPGHFVSYFPLAWDAQDILSAVAEAAQATYHLAWLQPNGRWQHPAVQVTRRGITIWIIVITSVGHHGNLIVWTGWPQ